MEQPVRQRGGYSPEIQNLKQKIGMEQSEVNQLQQEILMDAAPTRRLPARKVTKRKVAKQVKSKTQAHSLPPPKLSPAALQARLRVVEMGLKSDQQRLSMLLQMAK